MERSETLQWGRDLLVAERSIRAYAKFVDVAALQWGRDLLVAESLEANEPKKAAELLQWGRDLLVAERTVARWDAWTIT